MRFNLRADDEDELLQALRTAGLIDQWGRPAVGVTLDIIGPIFKETGEMREAEYGLRLPVMQAVPGWHANLIAELTPEQEASLPIIQPPKNPYRVFAGE